MATVAIDKSLDVINKYTSLINESLDTNSVYIRAKETLEALVTSGDLSSADKAKVVAEVLNNLNNSLVNASMSTALAWAKAEKDAEFQKEELGYKVDVIEQQALTEAAKVKQLMADVMATTATSMRQNGAAIINPATGFTTGLANDGKTYKELFLLDQELLNKKAEENVLKSKLKESQAAVYKIAADAAANYGNGFTVTSTGDAISVTGEVAAGTLAYYQKEIAKQQAKGYVYNAWGNAINASATAIATLAANDSTTTTQSDLEVALLEGVTKLLSANTASASAPTV